MTKDEAINGIKRKILTNDSGCQYQCYYFIEQHSVCSCSLTWEPVYTYWDWDAIDNKARSERTETCKALFKED